MANEVHKGQYIKPPMNKGVALGKGTEGTLNEREVIRGEGEGFWHSVGSFFSGAKNLWERCVYSEDKQLLGAMHKELKQFYATACSEDVNVNDEVRLDAAIRMLEIIDASRAFGSLPSRDVVRAMHVFHEQVLALPESDRNACIKKHLIDPEGRAAHMAKLMSDVSQGDSILSSVSDELTARLLSIAKDDPSYGAKQREAIESMLKALYPGAGYLDRVLAIGQLNCALANERSFSLEQRMEYQMRACLCVDEYRRLGYPDALPETLISMEKNLPVLNEVKVKLGDVNTSFKERHDAFLALHSYKEKCASIYGDAFNPFERGRSWSDYCSAFAEHALKGDNANMVGVPLLLEVCSLNPEHLKALAVDPHIPVTFQAVLKQAKSMGAHLFEETARLLADHAIDASTRIHDRMEIADALKKMGLSREANRVYFNLVQDKALGVEFRVDALRRGDFTNDQRKKISVTIVNEVLNSNFSKGVSEPVLLFNLLIREKLIGSDMQKSLRSILLRGAERSEDKRVQCLLPLMLGDVPKDVSAKQLGHILQYVRSVEADPNLSRDEKYLLGFLPMKAIVDLKLSPPHQECLQTFLNLGVLLFADPSALSSVWFHRSSIDVINEAKAAMRYAEKELKLPKDDVCHTVISDLSSYKWHTSLMQKRSRPIYHSTLVERFELRDEDGNVDDVLNVRWNPASIAKPLPKPKVPEASWEDFQTWASLFSQEVGVNDTQKELIRTLTGLGFEGFMEHADRSEFKAYLDPKKVEGAFVDPVALSLRRIIAYANTLSSEQESEGELSPKAKLFQQLLVNSTTCETGLKDAIELTAREIPSSVDAQDDLVVEAGISEDEMQARRKRAAFANVYLQESVHRRQALLNGDSRLTRELVGGNPEKRLLSVVHQSWMMDALLGRQVGVHSEGERFWVDPSSFCVYRKLYNTNPQDAMNAFYRHYHLQGEVAYFKERWNAQMALELKITQEIPGIQSKIRGRKALEQKEQDIARLAALRAKDVNDLTTDEVEEKKRLEEKALPESLTETEVKEKARLEGLKLDEKLAKMQQQSRGIASQIQAVLGSDVGDAYDYDEDFIPTGLNDYGVAMILLKLGVLEKVESLSHT